ncbi:MAG: bacteriohemerythrin [Magnetococcales bacterium]|nr:bacteriohemerythrin [Magnetococcales bacterium]
MSDPTENPILRPILLLSGIIILLALVVGGSLTWTTSEHMKSERFIREFHMAAAEYCDHIQEQIQGIRAQHAEEHLAKSNAMVGEKIIKRKEDHVQIMIDEFKKLSAVHARFHAEAARNEQLTTLMVSITQAFDQFLTIHRQFPDHAEIDPFYESAFDWLVILNDQTDALSLLHEKAVAELTDRQHANDKNHQKIFYLICFVIILIGFLTVRKILQIISQQWSIRLDAERALSARTAEHAKANSEIDLLERSSRGLVMALANLAENRDSDTGDHVLRVARLTHEIAREMGQTHPALHGEFMKQIALASMLHDVGKVNTPDSILLKPGKLSPEERAVMQEHARNGHIFLSKLKELVDGGSYLDLAIRIAGFHHEQYQGGGYPDGLAGESIPIEARIVAVADVFDALTSRRPYKQPWPEEQASTFIQEHSGKIFDPEVVKAFLQVFARRNQFLGMAWTEEMTVGVTVLDQDHQLLIQLINQLDYSCAISDPIPVGLVLIELVNYTRHHFAREEDYLRQIQFPGITRHQERHHDFAEQVLVLRQRFFRDQDLNLADELHQLMATWLTKHILVEDRAYLSWVTAHPAATVAPELS